MAVPKKRTSKSRRNKRRAHDALNTVAYVFDKTTGEPKLPHHISLSDGYYNERQVYITRAQKRAAKSANAEEKSSEPPSV